MEDSYKYMDKVMNKVNVHILKLFREYHYDPSTVNADTKELYMKATCIIEKGLREIIRYYRGLEEVGTASVQKRKRDDSLDAMILDYMAYMDWDVLFSEDAVASDEEGRILWQEIGKANPVTQVQFFHEMERKSKRFAEIMESTNGRQEAKIMSAKEVSRFEGWNAIETADEADRQKAKSNGFTHGIWHTQEDDRVCNVCDSRDGKKYPIDKLPTKPHRNCRCYFEYV